jgi:uncharacterized membrane protein
MIMQHSESNSKQRGPKQSWIGPTSLIALSVIPLLAGAVRVAGLSGSGPITPENARFVASPLPISLHIVSASVFCILGAFQFWPNLQNITRKWHKLAGRIMVPSGVVAAVTALWMTIFYPVAPNDGPLLYWERLIFGTGMLLSLILGTYAISQRDFPQHRKWMMRSYAISLGAGTQAVTQLPLILTFGPPSELHRGLLMGGAWVLNLLVAEWVLREPIPSALHRPFLT